MDNVSARNGYRSHVSDNGDVSLPLFNFKPIYLDGNADGEVKR